MQTRSRQQWGTILFAVGLVLGIALAVIAAWGDLEAMSYFYSGAGYGQFGGLHCPLLISSSETAHASATFDNPTNETIKPYFQLQISGVAATRNIEKQLEVPPHQSRTAEWKVDAQDVDLGSFVMMDLQVLPMAGYSTREATCGMVVANLPGVTGNQAVGWMLGVALVGILAGLMLREGSTEPVPGKKMTMRNGLRALALATLLAMLTGFIGWWVLAVLCIAVVLLLLVILLRVAVT